MTEEGLPPTDHRRLGRELNLFHVQEEAAGSVFWHPNGHTLFRTIETYIRDRLRKGGYAEVKTPQMVDRKLWQASGHWDNYRHNMFCTGDLLADQATDETGRVHARNSLAHADLAVKPMNCPCHVQIFNAQTVSYRQLPMRMAEFGTCHRNEPSGALHGIMRVRQFTQDDAHIFCTEEQVTGETARFIKLLCEVYADFGFTDIKVGLSTRPEMRGGTDEMWNRAEAALMEATKAAGLDFEVYPGEGAFYGPKLEFALRDLKGREWQCGTLQLDFLLPGRLGAEYTGEDGRRHTPVMLHRAILGSIERFIGILLEHYEGNLPAWLAPVQAAVLTVKPDPLVEDYARSIVRKLEYAGVRASLDLRDENLSAKVRDHSAQKVPFIIVVGDRDRKNEMLAIRRLGKAKQELVKLGEGIESIALLCAMTCADGTGPAWAPVRSDHLMDAIFRLAGVSGDEIERLSEEAASLLRAETSEATP